jgi:hypothetical protein
MGVQTYIYIGANGWPKWVLNTTGTKLLDVSRKGIGILIAVGLINI